MKLSWLFSGICFLLYLPSWHLLTTRISRRVKYWASDGRKIKTSMIPLQLEHCLWKTVQFLINGREHLIPKNQSIKLTNKNKTKNRVMLLALVYWIKCSKENKYSFHHHTQIQWMFTIFWNQLSSKFRYSLITCLSFSLKKTLMTK